MATSNQSKSKKGVVTRVFTDGACSGNPGIGGWGAVVLTPKNFFTFSGSSPMTTNNRMELTAVIKGLTFARKLKKKKVHVFSDSAYVVNAITKGWLYTWHANGWKKSDGEIIKNSEMWAALYSLITGGFFDELKFVKVKGHSGNHFNEMADSLARQAVVDEKKTSDNVSGEG